MIRLVSLALLSAAFISSAQTTNTVSSVNVVGYIQVVDPASNKYVLVSAPFNSGTGTVSTLIDIFGTNQLRQSSLVTRCDRVVLWDFVSQQYVQYAQKTNGLFYSAAAFNGASTNPAVTRGQAIWILSPAAAYAPTDRVIYVSGNVPNDGSFTNNIVGNSGSPLNFIANPYPVEMDLNNLINTNDGAKGSSIATKADKVVVWDSAAQQYITYHLKISATVPAVNNKWLLGSSFTATNPPTVKIQPGQGFWYQTTNSFTWIESKSYILQ